MRLGQLQQEGVQAATPCSVNGPTEKKKKAPAKGQTNLKPQAQSKPTHAGRIHLLTQF